jgi:hypothetical protein
MPHRIRLAAPWSWELTADQQLLRLIRHFHRPTGLQPHQPVCLCWETNLSGLDTPTLLLNQSPLSPPARDVRPQQLDISSQLQAHNTIEISFRTPALSGWQLPNQTRVSGRTIFNPSADTPWLSAVWLLIEELPQDSPRSSTND